MSKSTLNLTRGHRITVIRKKMDLSVWLIIGCLFAVCIILAMVFPSLLGRPIFWVAFGMCVLGAAASLLLHLRERIVVDADNQELLLYNFGCERYQFAEIAGFSCVPETGGDDSGIIGHKVVIRLLCGAGCELCSVADKTQGDELAKLLDTLINENLDGGTL